MLRGENIICGTTSTGTGTLSLAATPASVGATDLDVLARTTGIGFGNNAAILASYMITEYSDSTFKTPIQMEKGVGTLMLGASSGIANATLARTTLQQTATSLNAQPATYSVSAPSAINIGTAANTLVFIGASSSEVPSYSPYFDSTHGSHNGVVPPCGKFNGGGSTLSLASGTENFFEFCWQVPMLVKRVTFHVSSAYTGGTSDVNAALYDFTTGGQPGKLLYDFGEVGTSGASFAATGAIASGASGNGYKLDPGDFVLRVLAVFSGGSGTPQLATFSGSNMPPPLSNGRFGTVNFNFTVEPAVCVQSTGGVIGAAPDPANLTGYTPQGGINFPVFAFRPS